MKMLCIYGYGGMGREIADLAYRLNLWKEHVFIDDNVVSRIVDGLQVYTFDEIVDKFDKTDLEFIVATEPSTGNYYTKLEQMNWQA